LYLFIFIPKQIVQIILLCRLQCNQNQPTFHILTFYFNKFHITHAYQFIYKYMYIYMYTEVKIIWTICLGMKMNKYKIQMKFGNHQKFICKVQTKMFNKIKKTHKKNNNHTMILGKWL
jgi:hypothetical protein